MNIKKNFNRIPDGCVERFIPEHLLHTGVFKNMGLIYGGISTVIEGYNIQRIRNREYHIIIMTLSGAGSFLTEDGHSFLCEPQDVYFSHAEGQGHIHKPHKSPWKLLWLHFDPACTWFEPPCSDWELRHISSAERLEDLTRCLTTIINEEIFQEPESAHMQRLHAELFMLHVLREFNIPADDRQNTVYRHKFNRLWAQVSQSVNQSWKLSDLCDYMNLSSAHLSRLCRLMYRMSPGEKVKEIKMEHARAALKYFKLPVSHIAELVGYDNAATFSAAFKNHFGYPPSKIKS